MAIKVDKNKCIGCGACESICEKVFKLKDGKAYVKEQKNFPCVQEAIDSCPVNAISR
ncbi:MAG: ferredoxin [archaeon]|nr:ferredoxin [archaeon]